MERVALFVDVQNIFYTVRDAYHCHFNYTAFWKAVTNNRQVVKAFAYAIDRGDAKQREFQEILRKIGFEIKLKPYISRADGSSKGDWDVGITIDMLDYATKADILVLASGDGDFALLLDRIKQFNHVRSEVYGVPQLTAKSLMLAADKFYPIENSLLLRS